METAAINKTLVQLILSDEILELLQQARPDTSLHINALDGKGNPIKIICSLDANGQVSLDFEGGDTGSMFMSADNAVTSCVVKSVVHPAYLVMNSTSVNFNTELSTELPIAADVSDTSVTLPVDSDASLTCVGGDVVEMPLTVAADVSEVSILTCDHSDVDMHLTETDQLSTHNVVMHLDDIGATNIVLQYSDIVEDAGHMVLTSLNDHCYEIADDANHSIATVLYDDSCVE